MLLKFMEIVTTVTVFAAFIALVYNTKEPRHVMDRFASFLDAYDYEFGIAVLIWLILLLVAFGLSI